MVSPLKKSITRLIILVAACYLLPVACYAQAPQYVRVAVIQDAPFVRLKIKGKNLNTTVTAYKYGILMGDRAVRSDKLLIKSDGPDGIILGGRLFRGDIQFIKKDERRLLVVNYIDLEDYVKGILYNEASHYWPMEALKAQAIVSRTYAVYQMRQNRPRDYDVTADIYSQVYGGRASERYRTNKAVDETRGKILAYQDRALPAYFHATCGGHTEDASLLWNINIAPLKGVVCGFCRQSPHFNWHSVLSLEEIAEALNKDKYRINNIKEIKILGRDNSGRISDLRVISAQKEFKISAKDLRNILGPNVIKSANFQVQVAGGDAVFEGFGWGHGAGLCQWGAYFMAKQGYTAGEILKHYYPGSDIRTF